MDDAEAHGAVKWGLRSQNFLLRNFMVKYLQNLGGDLTTPPSATGGLA